jgi:hypothetical protein
VVDQPRLFTTATLALDEEPVDAALELAFVMR